MSRQLILAVALGCLVVSLCPTLTYGQIDIDKQLRERIMAPDSLLNSDTDADRHGTLQGYYLTSRTGDLRPAPLDTLRLNSYHRKHVEGLSIAESYLGTYAGPYQSKVYFDQPVDRWGDFYFLSPYFHLFRRGSMARYFDTKVPYTYLSVQKLGGSSELEQLLEALFTTNLGPNINLGGEAEIDKANGVYNNTASQALTYRLFGSYTKGRYEAFAEVGNTNVINQENGGITDMRYITNVQEIAGGRRTLLPRDIPTRYKSTWNSASYGRGRLHHRYRFGFYREYDSEGNLIEKKKEEKSLSDEVSRQDSLLTPPADTIPTTLTDSIPPSELQSDSLQTPPAEEKPLLRRRAQQQKPEDKEGKDTDEKESENRREFVPITSIFHDLTIERGSHEFVSQDPTLLERFPDRHIPKREGQKYYPYDRFSNVNISNTVGVELMEDFHKWAKMGISAFASFDYQINKQPLILPEDAERLDIPYEEQGAKLHSTLVGGRVKSDSFKHLKWFAQGHVGIEGYRAGEIDVRGSVDLSLSLFHRDVNLRASGLFLNEVPPYFLEHFKSTFHAWDRDLKNTQRLRLGAELSIPSTETRIFVNAETLQNPYFVDSVSYQPAQSESNVRVISAGFDQALRWRFLNLETSLVWQSTSDSYVTPMPAIAAYANFYLSTLIARVMTLQVGVDAKWHSKYFAPCYEPTTQMFAAQGRVEIGGEAPMMTAYANFHLKRARVFVRYYNVGSLIFQPNHFTMPYYPTYPPQVQLGIVVDLKN